jgi:threonine aldolase
MDERLASGLDGRGWRFYKFMEPDVYRLMCSWSTTEEEISSFIADVLAIK